MTDITSPPDGASISLPIGETSYVSFPETPSTGYTWVPEGSPDITLSSEFVRDSSTARAGTGGQRRFAICPTAPGTQIVSFELRRRQGTIAIDRRTIRINVEPTNG